VIGFIRLKAGSSDDNSERSGSVAGVECLLHLSCCNIFDKYFAAWIWFRTALCLQRWSVY